MTLTRNDLQAIEQLVKTVIKESAATKEDFRALNAHNIRIEENLAKLEINVNKKLSTLNNLFATKLDPFLKRVITAEEGNAILQAKEDGRQEMKKDLERRVTRIEKHLNLPQPI